MPEVNYKEIGEKLIGLEGVTSVAFFYDGLPVETIGELSDHEHISAMSEEMVRSGIKIAKELGIGDFEMLVLDSKNNKLLFFSFGEVAAVILTDPKQAPNLTELELKIRLECLKIKRDYGL
ncbi:MAG: hypothetical protein ACE5K4_02910 [Candidatus Hydrothermarchaeota archaeon]